ncbi:MAG: cobalamin biosynthesis protein [Clostridiales bacterium]|nr:cobalamin biosynthesis protein [Clostridiales bacterium]
MKKRIAIIFFTEQGGSLAGKMLETFRNTEQFSDEECPESPEIILYRKMKFPDCMNQGVVDVSESLHDWCASIFPVVDALIFIGASGIAVRTIAPFLVSKIKDPAVLVADEAGKHMISLLSGHLGGGNELNRFLAERLGADPVITTASDVRGKLAIDVWAQKNHLYITDLTAAKAVAARIVNGETVPFCCEGRVSGQVPPELKRVDADTLPEQDGAVIVSVRNKQISDRIQTDEQGMFRAKESEGTDAAAKKCGNLHLVPRAVILGIGCKKGKSAEEIRKFVFSLLREQKVAPQSICKIASIDLKAKEAGLKAFAEELAVPFVTFSAEKLNELPGEYTSSAFVSSVTGADNVCERAAMAAVDSGEREGARFLCRKAAGNGVTAALLEQPWEVFFE